MGLGFGHRGWNELPGTSRLRDKFHFRLNNLHFGVFIVIFGLNFKVLRGYDPSYLNNRWPNFEKYVFCFWVIQ